MAFDDKFRISSDIEKYIDPRLAQGMKSGTAEQKIDTLFSYMEDRGQSFYDEVVTQLEHALQCAALAQQNDASPTLITGALLHDIGHIILDEHSAREAFLNTDLNHEEVGAQYLSTLFPRSRHDTYPTACPCQKIPVYNRPVLLGRAIRSLKTES